MLVCSANVFQTKEHDPVAVGTLVSYKAFFSNLIWI